MEHAYVAPAHKKNAFNCPHCSVYAVQGWHHGVFGTMAKHGATPAVMTSVCSHCKKYALWLGDQMIDPRRSTAPPPAQDMPEDVKADYLEARNILAPSPRGATALLRLALQKLMPHLGEKGKDLRDDIGALVEKGLPVSVQEALDTLRVIGNNAVHPGQIDLTDDTHTASALFGILNFIVQSTLTQQKEIKRLYGMLPAGQKAGIAQRDGK